MQSFKDTTSESLLHICESLEQNQLGQNFIEKNETKDEEEKGRHRQLKGIEIKKGVWLQN